MYRGIGAIKLKIKGWIEDGEQYSNIPNKCPKCEGKLWRTDALSLCNILMVGCKDSTCRWCRIYSL